MEFWCINMWGVIAAGCIGDATHFDHQYMGQALKNSPVWTTSHVQMFKSTWLLVYWKYNIDWTSIHKKFLQTFLSVGPSLCVGDDENFDVDISVFKGWWMPMYRHSNIDRVPIHQILMNIFISVGLSLCIGGENSISLTRAISTGKRSCLLIHVVSARERRWFPIHYVSVG